MARNARTFTVILLLTFALSPASAQINLTGSISGLVSNALGIPQMGATVMLFNRLERQVARTLTDEKGVFQFDALPSDRYSVKVTLASFLPALRNNVAVQPGIRRILSINMAGVLSTIELVYSLPVEQGMMSDDWKWTLRSSTSTRPILRMTGISAEDRDLLRQMRSGSAVFSHTRGVVRLSAGDSTPAPTLGSQPDLGTAFALATSFLGSNQVELSGNLGYGSASGNPAAGFRTSFSRRTEGGRSPEVAIAMRQVFQAGRIGSRETGAPVLRTMSVGVHDQLQVMENTLLTYGATLESVQFFGRLNYVSPYAILKQDLDWLGSVEFGYSSGLPPAHLYSGATGDSDQGMAGLAMFPRLSLSGGRAHVQRAQNYELGYRKQLGVHTISLAAYKESLNNAALTAMGADGAFQAGDRFPDLFSTASVLNAGRYATTGYMASVMQNFSENWTATLAYGNSGVLEAAADRLRSDEMAELRGILHTRRRHWAVAGMSGKVSPSSTRFSASYRFMNGRALTPGHFYLTQVLNPSQGFNVVVRQPIPSMGMPGKLEASADVRNILAQGYQPMTLGSGRTIQLVHSPRALRGGLAFIF